jgi:hypothetical protein
MPTLTTPRTREGMSVRTGLWRYYSIDVGVTLLVDGATVTETQHPWQGDLADYDFVYLGGHIYDISADEATTLTNAGYGDLIT